MKFIITPDWEMQIRAVVLAAVKNSDAALADAIDTAVSEASSYLRSKYDTAKIFAPVYDWSATLSFPKDTRILFSAPAFSATSAYAQNALMSTGGYIYKAKAAIIAGAFNAAQWDNIATNNSFYYVVADNTTAGYLPTTSEYGAGDTRHPLLLTYTKDIALYHIHSNISPQNIPELRKKRYDDAIVWLNKVSKDLLDVDLPLSDESQPFGSMRLGGNTKYGERW